MAVALVPERKKGRGEEGRGEKEGKERDNKAKQGLGR